MVKKGGKKKKQSGEGSPSAPTSSPSVGSQLDQAGPSQTQQQPRQPEQSRPQSVPQQQQIQQQGQQQAQHARQQEQSQSQQFPSQELQQHGRENFWTVRGRDQGRGQGRGQDRGRGGRGRGGGRGFRNPAEGSQPNVSYHQQRPPPQQTTPWHQQQPQWQQQKPADERPEGSPVTKAADVVQETAELLSVVSLEEQSKDNSSKSEKKSSKLTLSADIANKEVEQIPKRKDPKKAGTKGRPITVKTNMLAINVQRMNPDAVHYDVDIVPNTPKYLMRPVFLEAKKKLFPNRNPAFDGSKNAFSAGELPIKDPSTAEVVVYNEDGREKKYTVTIKMVNRIDLSWLKTFEPGSQDSPRNQQISIQVLDVILRNAPSALKSISVRSSFFMPPKGQVDSLGGGMDLWLGLYQSAHLGWKPYFNVDVVHKGFPKPQSVLDLMKTICGCDAQDQGGQQQYGHRGGYGQHRGYGHRGGYGQRGYGHQGGYGQQQSPANLSADLIYRHREEIAKFLKGLKVTIEIPGQPTSRRTQRVNDLVVCPRDNVFERDDGHRISVEQYYKLEKKYTIKYPDFPCLWVGGKNKNIHVPPEICTIVGGQATQKKLDENQTSSMIRFAATGPEERKKKIMDAFNSMRHNQDPCMREFGISVSGEFETVAARVLDPPELTYQSQNARVSKGVWRASHFIKPSQSILDNKTWTILNLDNRTRDDGLYKLADTLKRKAIDVGMPIGEPFTPFTKMELKGHDIRGLMEYFNEMKMKKIKLVVVVVPEMKCPYSKVKQIRELKVGVLTQCIKSKTVYNLKDMTAGNILLKINAKLNGTNHVLEPQKSLPACLKSPCMIVGADVTHPSPDSKGIPSIAAVVASHDLDAFNYNVEIRLQPPNTEHIEDLTEILKIQLKFFYDHTRQYPKKIIIFRDGVSEGHFGKIMHIELRAIQKACQSIQADGLYKPQITFLVVQKRHHTRLFPTDLKNSDDKHGNVQAGTIVDTNITHPSHIDFYLVSHASIQGTARPTKYRCLWDDSDMSEDEIENLTYFLCHMFSRCTRSVSYPTPTYYAHLAAFRARALIQDVDIDINNLPQEQLKKLTIKEEILKSNPMFFV